MKKGDETVNTITEKTAEMWTPPRQTPVIEVAVKRCAIYIRVSTAEQRIDGWSLEAQEAGLRAYAKSMGWKVVEVYADEGKSARKRLKDRKAIHRLMADVKAGLIDVILFKELDRWFRSISDFYKIQDVLDQVGVEWVSQQQPGLEMRTKEGRLQVNVLLSVGQNETDATSDRIKYTNKFLRAQKRWTSGARTLPRCYTLDENQQVILDESPGRAPYVRDLIENFFHFGTIQRAMRVANADHPPGMLYNNAVSLLRNPMLYGEYQEIEDFVENPLMTKKEWLRMQELMIRNARDTDRQLYIFAGLVTCGCCGLKLGGTHTAKDGKEYKYYRCRAAKVQHTCKNKASMNEEKLEALLFPYIRETVAEQIVEVKRVTQNKKKKPAKKSNKAAIEKRLKKLKKMYLEDDEDKMTWEQYQEERKEILAELIEEDEPEEKLPELADLKKVQDLFDSGVEELYQTFTLEERREFWRGVLTQVKVNEKYEIVDVDFVE